MAKSFEEQLEEHKAFLERLYEEQYAKNHPVEMKLKQIDRKHYKQTEAFVNNIAKTLDKLISSACFLCLQKIDPSDYEKKRFLLSSSKALLKLITEELQKGFRKIEVAVQYGANMEWEAAQDKNDYFVRSLIDVEGLDLKKRVLYMGRHEAAKAAFMKRKVEGLELSKRIWKYMDPFKQELEEAIDCSLTAGMSAQRLSQEVRSCLIEPDKLFRRVRDKYGNLTLSKAAKNYHPGQGVYRSSYKNAMRVARSEINMAYRSSDYERWQALDFVVGIKVNLSNNHTTTNPKGKGRIHLHDICDELAGDYPKDFKFVGWHPQCRCFATPILQPLEEMNLDRSLLNSVDYKSFPASNSVHDVPANFKDYLKSNKERIAGWKNIPYYIKDNPKYTKILKD